MYPNELLYLWRRKGHTGTQKGRSEGKNTAKGRKKKMPAVRNHKRYVQQRGLRARLRENGMLQWCQQVVLDMLGPKEVVLARKTREGPPDLARIVFDTDDGANQGLLWACIRTIVAVGDSKRLEAMVELATEMGQLEPTNRFIGYAKRSKILGVDHHLSMMRYYAVVMMSPNDICDTIVNLWTTLDHSSASAHKMISDTIVTLEATPVNVTEMARKTVVLRQLRDFIMRSRIKGFDNRPRPTQCRCNLHPTIRRTLSV